MKKQLASFRYATRQTIAKTGNEFNKYISRLKDCRQKRQDGKRTREPSSVAAYFEFKQLNPSSSFKDFHVVRENALSAL